MEIVTTKKSRILIEYNKIELNRIFIILKTFLHDYALMNSFYITCTLAASQRKRKPG